VCVHNVHVEVSAQ